MEIAQETMGTIQILHFINGGAKRADIKSLLNIITKDLVHPFSKVIIDLEQIKLIDSSGLGILIAATIILRESNSKLILVGLNDTITKIMQTTRIYKKFNIVSTTQEAIQL